SKYMIRDIILEYQKCYGLNGVEPTAVLPNENGEIPTTETGTGTGTATGTATGSTTGTGTRTTSSYGTTTSSGTVTTSQQ
ncbi:MAG: hypothetical protein K2H28_05795, partial [Ruminococcus sp.]|nr:hypothetical protein [Ruminococcus sp.]